MQAARKAIMQAPKNGFFYVLNSDKNAELIHVYLASMAHRVLEEKAEGWDGSGFV